MNTPIEKFACSQPIRLIGGTLGIYLCYSLSSLLNERILKVPYASVSDPTKQDLFTYPLALLMASGLLSWMVGALVNNYLLEKDDDEDEVPERHLARAAMMLVTSLLAYNQAVMYLDYPTAMMTKSCSILFVVVVGVFFSNVRNPQLKLSRHKIFVGGMVALGAIVFYLEGTASQSGSDKPLWGFCLLLISLVADGFLPDAQAQIKSRYCVNPTTLYENTNRWVFLLAWALSILTMQMKPIFYFLMDHPQAVLDIGLEAVLIAIGQLFSYYLVMNFKQHILPLIITTRKSFSVMLSILVYQHQIQAMQWLGLLLILAGILGQVFWQPLKNHLTNYKRSRQPTVI